MTKAKNPRQDPRLKAVFAERITDLIERSGVQKSAISFRAGWSRNRINGFMSGDRTPDIQAMLELDKVLEPYLGPYASFQIIYGKSITDLNERYQDQAPEVNRASIDKAIVNCLNDYIKKGRIKTEPKLNAREIANDIIRGYLKKELD